MYIEKYNIYATKKERQHRENPVFPQIFLCDVTSKFIH